MKINFISGLPRSGSTLLAAILNQNKHVRAGMSSPVSAIAMSVRTMMSNSREISTQVSDDQREHILRGIFSGYYHDASESTLVFDTSRAWAGRLHEVLCLFPEAKFIITLRDPAWVFESVERIIRANPLRQSNMVQAASNIDERCTNMISSKGFIGGPLGNVKEAVFGPHADRVLLIEYDALCLNPELALNSVYDFIGEPRYQHDFSFVSYQQESFDEALQTPGLHRVEGAVRYIPRRTILPPELFSQLSAKAFWRSDEIDRVSCVFTAPVDDTGNARAQAT